MIKILGLCLCSRTKVPFLLRRMSDNSGRGALIVFEGCDRVGKSTQCSRLAEALQAAGHRCKLMHFPDRSTTIGKCISSYLKNEIELSDKSIHLMFSANRWELMSEMESTLMKGTSLIVDRYAYSGVAYTAAKEVASVSWCKGPDSGVLRPDKVFFLKMSAKAAQARATYGEERYEKVAFQKKVEDKFMKLKEKTWTIVDASQDIETIHSEIMDETLTIIANCDTLPTTLLWTDTK